MCYRDFCHWEKSYKHMCSDTIIFHMCWYWFLVNQQFSHQFEFFWIQMKCLFNKQNKTWARGDMKFIFEYSNWYLTSDFCNLIGSQQCDLIMNRTILCFKSYCFEEPMILQKTYHLTNQITEKRSQFRAWKKIFVEDFLGERQVWLNFTWKWMKLRTYFSFDCQYYSRTFQNG